ncbi:MAG: nickel pincer cofactor biosynthesis protein LarB [Deltaproteobacteria bacterium]|nr:nickel pincer cofactor biosynthesis protein LarB [Deltaproteobacteria bacterium]
MNREAIAELLRRVRARTLAPEAAIERLRRLPFERLGEAMVDTHREVRTGIPEVVFAPGKTDELLERIVRKLLQRHGTALVTRLPADRFRRLRRALPAGVYGAAGGVLSIRRRPAAPPGPGPIAVVTAGSADVPVAEEAGATLEHLGWPVARLYDIGVAGLHRLLDAAPRIDAARVAIVVAGMEGALPTVVAGLTPRPVIAVPTSVGYGASFGGVAALLAMLNSCSGGVAVVNIDNGFGAACFAHRLCTSAGEFRAKGAEGDDNAKDAKRGGGRTRTGGRRGR